MKLIDLDADKGYLLDGKYKVETIVRCKDCEYQHSIGGGEGWCDRAVVDADDYNSGIVNAEDDNFCSFGEWKDGRNKD